MEILFYALLGVIVTNLYLHLPGATGKNYILLKDWFEKKIKSVIKDSIFKRIKHWIWNIFR